jgi:hypothetical protein
MQARWIAWLLSCGIFAACGSSKGADSTGVGQVCAFYEQLALRTDADRLSDKDRYEAIRERVTALEPNLLARQAWEAAVSAQAGQRYEAFKMMVDSELPKPFECTSMKTLFR